MKEHREFQTRSRFVLMIDLAFYRMHDLRNLPIIVRAVQQLSETLAVLLRKFGPVKSNLFCIFINTSLKNGQSLYFLFLL